MGNDKVNPEIETNMPTGGNVPENNSDGVIKTETDEQEIPQDGTEEAMKFVMKNEGKIIEASEKVQDENNRLINLDKMKGFIKASVFDLKFKAYELAKGIKDITLSKVAILGSTAALAFIFVSCTNKESTPTPQIMAYQPDAMPVNENQGEDIQVQPTPTMVIEPTATETPPDVDLGWDWSILIGSLSRLSTEEDIEEYFEGQYENLNKPIYMIFNKEKMFFSDKMVIPLKEEDLQEGSVIKKLNDGLQLNLDELEEEILKQFYLYKINDGKKMRLYIFIDENGCPYEKDGAVTIIRKADNEKGFEPKVYRQEDIPWNEIPQEYWGDIKAGNTKIDMSGDKIVCSCNINDIGVPSPEE